MDRSFISSNGQGGIGGIFRYNHGNPLMHFGKQFVVDSGNHAEILALREGLLVVAASRWGHSIHFLIESDSSNVVFWLTQPSKRPWHFQNIIREIFIQFGHDIQWSINHIRLQVTRPQTLSPAWVPLVHIFWIICNFSIFCTFSIVGSCPIALILSKYFNNYFCWK